jgi:hypothetical protein
VDANARDCSSGEYTDREEYYGMVLSGDAAIGYGDCIFPYFIEYIREKKDMQR